MFKILFIFVFLVIPSSDLFVSYFLKWNRQRLTWKMKYPRVQRVNQTLMDNRALLDWTLIMTTQSLVAAAPHTQRTGGRNFSFENKMTLILISR